MAHEEKAAAGNGAAVEESEAALSGRGGKRRIKVISFDLDDTLFACKPVLSAAAESQSEFLKKNFPHVFEHAQGEKWQVLFNETRKNYPEMSHHFTFLRRKALQSACERAGVSDEEQAEIIEGAWEAFINTRNDVEKHIYPGVVERLLELKKAGFKMVSLTNGNCDISKVPSFAETNIFDHLISAESAGAAKPNPEPFRKVIELAGADHPSEVLHVGDSLISDVTGARVSGMRTVWVNRHRIEEPEDHGADLVLNCVKDLELDLLHRLHLEEEEELEEKPEKPTFAQRKVHEEASNDSRKG